MSNRLIDPLDPSFGFGFMFKDMQPPPPDVREAYKGTNFNCPECNGDVWPQTMETGKCFSCKREWNLNECEYEIEEKDEEE